MERDIDRLDPYQKAYYLAKLRRDSDSINLLVRSVAASLPTGVHSSRGIQKLIRNHFGQGISFISIRTDLRCKNVQVRAYQKAVREKMLEIRTSLEKALENNGKNR